MNRKLAVNCTPILICSMDNVKPPAETSFYEMVIGVVRTLCELSLLVYQLNHSDLSLNALDDALKRFYQTNGIVREQTMWKSAKAKVDDLVARESHQLCEQKIHRILAAMEAVVYRAEKVSTSKCTQFQVRLSRV
jgi:hypothetical protein